MRDTRISIPSEYIPALRESQRRCSFRLSKSAGMKLGVSECQAEKKQVGGSIVTPGLLTMHLI